MLHNRYWGETINTAVYLQNRSPIKGAQKTPYELWHGEKPDVSHLRIFGCSAYAHIPQEKRQKLDEKADILIFVGYELGTKGYRLLNPRNDTIRISRDVKFVEFLHDVEAQNNDKTNENSNFPVEDDKEIIVDLLSDLNASMKEQQESEEIEQQQIPRRSERKNKGQPAARLIDEIGRNARTPEYEIALLSISGDPKNRAEALAGTNHKHWEAAMDDEFASFKSNNTWELTELPEGRKTLGCKWVLKTKHNEAAEIERYEARWLYRVSHSIMV